MKSKSHETRVCERRHFTTPAPIARVSTRQLPRRPCAERRISYFQKVEIIHFVQDDIKNSFARGSMGYFENFISRHEILP